VVFQGSPNPVVQQAAVQEPTEPHIRTKRMRTAVVALVGWILASQCRSKDTGPQHHEEVPIHAGELPTLTQIELPQFATKYVENWLDYS
jgi:hypothetical protein